MQRWPSVTDESSGEVDLDDRVVLDVERQRAADAAVRADRVGHRLGALVPRPGGPHVVLGLEHQRAGRADADAVAAVDARRIGQRDGLLGRDPGVEAAPGDGDRERVLGVLAARLDALVAEDALRVVADVEVVVDLDRLARRSGRGVGAGRRVMVAGLVRVALAGVGGRRGRRRSAPGRRRSARCSRRPPARSRGRPTSRGTRGPSSGCGGRARCRSGPPSRPRPCASRRHEDARAGDLDDADAADVDRRQVLEIAERRRVDALAPGRPRGSSSRPGR